MTEYHLFIFALFHFAIKTNSIFCSNTRLEKFETKKPPLIMFRLDFFSRVLKECALIFVHWKIFFFYVDKKSIFL